MNAAYVVFLYKIQSPSRFVTFIEKHFRYGDCFTKYKDKCMSTRPRARRLALCLRHMNIKQQIGCGYWEQHN